MPNQGYAPKIAWTLEFGYGPLDSHTFILSSFIFFHRYQLIPPACLYTISQNEDKIDKMSQLSLSCHHHHLMPLDIKTLSSLVLNHFHLDWGWYLPEKTFSLPIMHFSVFIMSSSSHASGHQDPIIISSQSLPFRLRLISTRENIQSSHNAFLSFHHVIIILCLCTSRPYHH